MKLKAFTLVDIVVGMCLGAIFLSFGIELIVLSNDRIKVSQTHREDRIDQSTQLTVIVRDFERCDSIALDKSQILVLSQHDTIKYLQMDEYLIREINSVIDTFQLRLEFLGNQRLEIIDIYNGEENIFSYKKDYRSITLE